MTPSHNPAPRIPHPESRIPTTVMLVEDNPEYRDVIDFALKDDPGIDLQSQFGTAEFALRSLQDMSTRIVPDIILLDLKLPGMSGLEALPHFRQSAPEAKVIILTQSDREADIVVAISGGASGYLLKSCTVNEVKDGIQTVMRGGASLDASVAKFILGTFRKSPAKAQPEHTLTDRELEILQLQAEGLAKKEIADRLDISTHTVSNHIRHIYEKLEVPNAPAAVSKAYKTGILPAE